jgi:hypothetical protein
MRWVDSELLASGGPPKPERSTFVAAGSRLAG